MKKILLSGGGLDSSALFLYLRTMKVDFEVLHFNYGQKAFKGERLAVNYFCEKYGIKRVENSSYFDFSSTGNVLLTGMGPSVGDSPEAINKNKLECRNLVLLSMVVSLVASFGGGDIYLAYHKEPIDAPFPDATSLFLSKFRSLVEYSTGEEVRILAPFQEHDFSRQLIFNYGLKKDPEFVEKSFTCYESTDEVKCGSCAHCLLENEMLSKKEEELCRKRFNLLMSLPK